MNVCTYVRMHVCVMVENKLMGIFTVGGFVLVVNVLVCGVTEPFDGSYIFPFVALMMIITMQYDNNG